MSELFASASPKSGPWWPYNTRPGYPTLGIARIVAALRPLLKTASTFLIVGFVLMIPAAVTLPGAYGALYAKLAWAQAHGWLLVAGFLLPIIFGLHLHVLEIISAKEVHPDRITLLRSAVIVAAIILGIGGLIPDGATGFLGTILDFVPFLGLLLVFIAAILQTVTVFGLLPKNSVVDVEADPLSKGDDASLKHVKMSHMFLPLGILLVVAGFVPGQADHSWAASLRLAGMHVLLVGYLTLSAYGIAHILIPRFSGVPAIAAGAIKGELYTTLLGLLGIVAGFIVGPDTRTGRILLISFGPLVFLGMFTFMGVLGANIMKNKSKTHRVTREFVYVPWTFAGVFWLISGILMGIFLNVVPDALADRENSLRFMHIHTGLFGGIAMLAMGWLYRILPSDMGIQPPSFARTKWSFYLLNAALLVVIPGHLAGVDGEIAVGIAAAFALIGAIWFVVTLKPYWKVA